MIELEKPWWVKIIEALTDWECSRFTLHEMRFRRKGEHVTNNAAFHGA